MWGPKTCIVICMLLPLFSTQHAYLELETKTRLSTLEDARYVFPSYIALRCTKGSIHAMAWYSGARSKDLDLCMSR